MSFCRYILPFCRYILPWILPFKQSMSRWNDKLPGSRRLAKLYYKIYLLCALGGNKMLSLRVLRILHMRDISYSSFKIAQIGLNFVWNIDWVSNSFDPGETPSFSASRPDQSCLHMAFLSRLFFKNRSLIEKVIYRASKRHAGV